MLPALLIVVCALGGFALHWERRRIDALGIASSLQAGIDPVTGLLENEAAAEHLRLQLLTANRLRRPITIARRWVQESAADPPVQNLVEQIQPGITAVRPQPNLLTISTFNANELALLGSSDAWEIHSLTWEQVRDSPQAHLSWAIGERT